MKWKGRVQFERGEQKARARVFCDVCDHRAFYSVRHSSSRAPREPGRGRLCLLLLSVISLKLHFSPLFLLTHSASHSWPFGTACRCVPSHVRSPTGGQLLLANFSIPLPFFPFPRLDTLFTSWPSWSSFCWSSVCCRCRGDVPVLRGGLCTLDAAGFDARARAGTQQKGDQWKRKNLDWIAWILLEFCCCCCCCCTRWRWSVRVD